MRNDIWTGSEECGASAATAEMSAELTELGMMLSLLLGVLAGGGSEGFSTDGFPGAGFPTGGFPGAGFPTGGLSMGVPTAGFPTGGFPMGLPANGFPTGGFRSSGFFPASNILSPREFLPSGGLPDHGALPFSPYRRAAPAPAWPASAGNQAQRAVGVAASQVGVVGGNRRVREYSQGRSEPWCADFVSWCYENSGRSPFGHRAGVESIASWGRQNGCYHSRGKYTPRPGDIVIFGDEQHTGLVERVDPDGTVHTIEGNTSGYGKRGGRTARDGAVARHSFNPNSGWLTGYVDMQRYR